ncbi:mast cell protease 1A-like isoform X1 [Nyctibius grandis]|uniref:mast cell protease 1A-like isoform X1 n=1 Tax=Nyctibius grandis TaxID=48427 RepID=UPI0035BC17AD
MGQCQCSTGSDCGGPRGSAPLPPLHGIPEDRDISLWRLPGGPWLGDDSCTLHGGKDTGETQPVFAFLSSAATARNATVILGAHNIHEPETTQQIRGVLGYYQHPAYDPNTVSNDIMLLKLTAKATLNDYVKTIPLPKTSSDLPTGTKCSIAGWGLIDDDQTTNKLFETKVSIYSRRKCIHFYPHLNTGMVCAGSFHELRDSSQGDSGGPLVCNKVAQGIVSFGYDTPPGVYTRISNYLRWIKRTLKK